METSFERVIGSYESGRPGPVVVVTAGIHGNEPAGTRALRRVFHTLETHAIPLRGKLLGLGGNLEALKLNQRFVEHDLNRGWTMGRVQALLTEETPELLTGEDREQWELLRAFFRLFTAAQEPIVFLDLHSTSAGGSPFCAIADTLRNRRIAFALPAPVILGLEETVHGTMLSYLDELGHIASVFEGGQHDDPKTEENHESAVWIALVAAGAVSEADVPDYHALRDRLAQVTTGQPAVVELRYRHPVAPTDEFRMKPGYLNFQKIEKGEVLATSRLGDVTARESGRILMPLYQAQGEDGFFFVQEVKRFWLRVSWLIRKLRLDKLIRWFPGVRNHPDLSDSLLVDPRVARYFVVEIFHLCGYRKAGEEGGELRFQRRRPDSRKLASLDNLVGSRLDADRRKNLDDAE